MMQKRVRELENKIKELQTICVLYSECVYSFLGKFSEKTLTKLATFEQLAFKQLKEKIDAHISSNNYKSYLKHKYIDKDLTDDILFDLVAIEADAKFSSTILEENFKEDDTETFNIIEHKDIKEGH